MSLYAEVVLSLPLNQTFFYIVPESYGEKAKIGSRVLVPLHQRMVTGFIVNLRKKSLPQKFRLKEIREILDEKPVFSASFLSFTRKLSDYYYSSWGEVLQASLPPSFILKSQTRILLSEKGESAIREKNLLKEERALMDFLKGKSYTTLFLKRKFKERNLPLLLSRLEEKGFVCIQRDIMKAKRRTRKTSAIMYPTQLEMDFSLDPHSRHIADQIVRKIEKQVFSPFFLLGPSDKREAVYFYLIKRILAEGKKALFLVPEIVLTQTLREQVERRLGEKAALLHSRLSEKGREQEWQKIKEGDVDVVVGPRSALFSPLDQLGLIIVDEEQDESYYQQESPCYSAQRGAWLRAKQEGAVLVYGSAFPSVEAFYRARRRRYLLCLESEARKKRIEIIDDRLEKGLLSRKLKERIKERLEKRESTLVFFNRRGYASFLHCSRCNCIPRCVRCDIALTYHKKEERLICHYCNYSHPKMDYCSECGSRMIRKGGIGIEAVEEELREVFPQSKILSFDTDVIKSKGKQEGILRQFRRGKIDILVGTQLLAHQADLSSVSLVAILYPETILTLSDYRASQKTFQTLSQMMKFIRNDNKSEIIIQTALPHHFSIQRAAFEDYFSFFSQEIKFRRIMNYPPFSCMVEILFQAENLRNLACKSREFSSQVKRFAGDIEILGPALASVSKVRGINRVQIILKAQRKNRLDKIMMEFLNTIKLRKSIWVYD